MRKCYVLNSDNLIFYCEPETTSELDEWYPKYFDISVGEYKRIVDCITRGKRKFVVSFYSAYRKMNSLEKARGMKKVFAQRGISYEEKYGEIAEEDGETSIFSIADFSEKNEEAFFCGVCSPQVILCISNDEQRETSILNSSNKKMDYIINKLLQNGDTVVRFSDYSCDGNSITVLNKNTTDLFKEIYSEGIADFKRQ